MRKSLTLQPSGRDWKDLTHPICDLLTPIQNQLVCCSVVLGVIARQHHLRHLLGLCQGKTTVADYSVMQRQTLRQNLTYFRTSAELLPHIKFRDNPGDRKQVNSVEKEILGVGRKNATSRLLRFTNCFKSMNHIETENE